MADNIQIDAPTTSGATMATDDIGGVQYPRSKISLGADGAAADLAATNPMPVGGNTVKNGSGTVYALLVDADGHLQADVLSCLVTNAGTFAVQAAQSGTWTVTGAGGTFPITDSGGSVTVDAPVGTPVFVRLSDGTGAISTLPCSFAFVPEHHVTNQGEFAVQVDGNALAALELLDDVVYTDNGAFTDDVSKFALVGGVYQLSPQTITDGRVAPILLDANGKVQVASHAVTLASISSSVTPGTSAAHLGKAEDAGHTTGDTGVGVWAVRRDSPAVGSSDDGDYSTLNVDGSGRLWCNVNNTVTVAAHAVTNAGTFAVQVDGTALTRLTDIETNTDSGAVVGNGAAATAQRVTLANDSTGVLATVTTVTTVSTVTTLTGGAIAHDSADSGNPHKIGAKATTALSGKTLVADNDRTDLFAGIDGVQITRPHANLEDIVSGLAAITDGSSTSVISAAGSGVKIYITSVIISNSSATAVTVDLRDGTGGTVKATFPVPANTGGVVCNLPVPIPFSANTAVAADPSAAASTVTVTLIGFKSKV